MSVSFASYGTLLTRRKLLLRMSCFDLAAYDNPLFDALDELTGIALRLVL